MYDISKCHKTFMLVYAFVDKGADKQKYVQI